MLSNSEAKKIMALCKQNEDLYFVNMNDYKILTNSNTTLGTWNLQTCVGVAISVNSGEVRYLSHINLYNLLSDNEKPYNILKNSLKELNAILKTMKVNKMQVELLSTYSYCSDTNTKNEMLFKKVIIDALKDYSPQITHKKAWTCVVTKNGETKALTFEKEQELKKQNQIENER